VTTTAAPLLSPLDRAPRLTFARVARSERTKLTSLRSTWLIAALTVFLSAAASAAVALTDASDPAGALAGGAATTLRTMAPATTVGELFAAVLVVLFVTQEFSTGQKRTTYAAVPRRLPVLAAKTLVAAGAAVVLSVASSVAAWAASSVLLWSTGLRTSLVDPAVLQAVGAAAAWLAVLTVFTVMVATLVRSSAGAIAIVLGVLLVLPVAVVLLTAGDSVDWSALLLTYAETTMSQLFSGTEPAADMGRDLGALATWLVVPTVAAAWATARRDV
jgi:ABC-2 type transport system permease protein